MDNDEVRAIMTEWRRVPISPYRNYEVSDQGEVRRGARILRINIDRYGYGRVGLYYAGLRKQFKLHRLVCETFHGACPEGKECAHLDGDQTNNRPANLAWVTRAENIRHQIEHGTINRTVPQCDRRGEANGYAKLTQPQVDQIRAEGASASQRELARRFGISQSRICHILAGKAWT